MSEELFDGTVGENPETAEPEEQPKKKHAFTRRNFIRGALVLAAASMLPVPAWAADPARNNHVQGVWFVNGATKNGLAYTDKTIGVNGTQHWYYIYKSSVNGGNNQQLGVQHQQQLRCVFTTELYQRFRHVARAAGGGYSDMPGTDWTRFPWWAAGTKNIRFKLMDTYHGNGSFKASHDYLVDLISHPGYTPADNWWHININEGTWKTYEPSPIKRWFIRRKATDYSFGAKLWVGYFNYATELEDDGTYANPGRVYETLECWQKVPKRKITNSKDFRKTFVKIVAPATTSRCIGPVAGGHDSGTKLEMQTYEGSTSQTFYCDSNNDDDDTSRLRPAHDPTFLKKLMQKGTHTEWAKASNDDPSTATLQLYNLAVGNLASGWWIHPQDEKHWLFNNCSGLALNRKGGTITVGTEVNLHSDGYCDEEWDKWTRHWWKVIEVEFGGDTKLEWQDENNAGIGGVLDFSGLLSCRPWDKYETGSVFYRTGLWKGDTEGKCTTRVQLSDNASTEDGTEGFYTIPEDGGGYWLTARTALIHEKSGDWYKGYAYSNSVWVPENENKRIRFFVNGELEPIHEMTVKKGTALDCSEADAKVFDQHDVSDPDWYRDDPMCEGDPIDKTMTVNEDMDLYAVTTEGFALIYYFVDGNLEEPCWADKTDDASSKYNPPAEANAAAEKDYCSGLVAWFTDPECMVPYEPKALDAGDYLYLYGYNKVTITHELTAPAIATLKRVPASDRPDPSVKNVVCKYGDVLTYEAVGEEAYVYTDAGKEREITRVNGWFTGSDAAGDIVTEVVADCDMTLFHHWQGPRYDGIIIG